MATPIPYKLKNGQTRYKITVYAGIDENGKQININKQGFKTKAEANRWEAFKRTEIATQGLPSDEANLGFTEAYKVWFEGYKSTVAESTYLMVSKLFENHLLPFFKNKKLPKINKLDCQRLINYLHKQMPATYKKKYTYFTRIMKEFGYPITHDLVFPKQEKTIKDKVIYTKEELNLFLDQCKKHHDPRVYPYFRLIAYTGVRKGEAGALMKDCVTDTTITIKRSLTRSADGSLTIGPPKNESSTRTITVDPETIEALRSIMTDDDLVFGKGFEPINQPRKWLRKICKEIDLEPITIHGLRHTHCSLLFEAGMTVKEVQDRLGHANPEMTLQVYTHVTQSQARNIPNKFVDFMSST